MNFNSPQFFWFLPIVIVLYLLVLRRERPRDLLLLVASYYFYMQWNWKYAGLMALSTVADYLISSQFPKLTNPRSRRALLFVSLSLNLGLLGFFKYYHFALETTSTWILGGRFDLSGWYHNFLLPVGISFYTFQTLSYTIDVYRGQIAPEPSFIKFALFVAFFPQLVAGPIVRASTFLPQLHRQPPVCRDTFNRGLFLIFRGLFKKIILADLLAQLGVDEVFRNPAAFSSIDLLFAIYGYAFQIYNDFSGYSDIAIGAAQMLGFELPENFNRPYISADLREFWSRWHISLSTWIRDYLYFPLGGSRGTPTRTAINLLITMLLAGLWHGAALNFVAWGFYHAILLIALHLKWFSWLAPKSRLMQQLICFHCVCGGWLLFRIGNLTDFIAYGQGMSRLAGGTQLSVLYYCVLATAATAHLLPEKWAQLCATRLIKLPAIAQGAVMAMLLLVYCGCSLDAPSFIYFQF